MKLHVMSDLHMEFWSKDAYARFFVKLEKHAGGADAAILAGDICNIGDDRFAETFVSGMKRFAEIYPQVYYVPGNHEFWGSTFGTVDAAIGAVETANKNVSVLSPSRQPSNLVSSKLNISGGTMWFPPGGLYPQHWCDFNRIHDSEKIYSRHQDFLDQNDLGDVVVTHHLPTSESIAPEWIGSSTNDYFCAHLEEWILSRRQLRLSLPKLWVHGHTHNATDFQSAYGFRVYCNPLGYPSEGLNPGFWDRLMVEI
jgi:Icc-related predicted phosphoesterase